MKTKKLTIAGGNTTLLVWDCTWKNRTDFAKHHLDEVEQVGFVKYEGKLSVLTMMGGELSVNGTLALASLLGRAGELKTSGLDEVVKYKNSDGKTCIEIKLNFKRPSDNIILFDGIGYLYSEKNIEPSKKELYDLASKYKLPAFGIVIGDQKAIIPWVYVKKTNSLMRETACGSGGVATSIVTGSSNIIQPTGKPIKITNNANSFTVCAEVKNSKVVRKSNM